MVKIQQGLSEQRLVTILRELAKTMGFQKGEVVEFSVKDSETLELKKK